MRLFRFGAAPREQQTFPPHPPPPGGAPPPPPSLPLHSAPCPPPPTLPLPDALPPWGRSPSDHCSLRPLPRPLRVAAVRLQVLVQVPPVRLHPRLAVGVDPHQPALDHRRQHQHLQQLTHRVLRH